jgi:hypothetical protein
MNTSRGGNFRRRSHLQRVGAEIPYRTSTPVGQTTAVPACGPRRFLADSTIVRQPHSFDDARLHAVRLGSIYPAPTILFDVVATLFF